ncbi:MAG: hypothetical protein Q9M32_03520 [Sulfurimonas sp.]|nr:hypothetical protein [Sulfurimonas sp.]MDQ7059955.1 hypothetical protein [Sulfurimonas sp.]
MRSRDGNYYRSLAICSLIFFNSFALYADEYLISYRYIVKDAALYNESLQISPAMKPCRGEATSFIELPVLKNETLDGIIQENSQEFIDYLHKIGLNLEYQSTTTNYQQASTAIHTLKTTCFKVDFNDNFVKISPLK